LGKQTGARERDQQTSGAKVHTEVKVARHGAGFNLFPSGVIQTLAAR
jgi:hypothetical protein